MSLLVIPARQVWVDMPASLTEFQGLKDWRTKRDLSKLATVVHATQITGTNNANFQISKNPWNTDHTIKAGRVRLVVNVISPGATGSVLRAQYSLDGSAWSYLDGATGPSVAIDSTTGDTPRASSVITPENAALADVYLRIVGLNGDAALDPIFGLIELQETAA